MLKQTRLHEGVFIASDGRHLPFERIVTPILITLLKRCILWRDDARAWATATALDRADKENAIYGHLSRILTSRGVILERMHPKQCCQCTRVAVRVVKYRAYWKGYCSKHTANAFLARRRQIQTEVEPYCLARSIAIKKAKVRADTRALNKRSLHASRKIGGSIVK